jgi:hypothetical protein
MKTRIVVASGVFLAALAYGAGSLPVYAQDQPKPAAKSSGRAAMHARQRACGEEWNADKAAGKIAAGTKWPQYWHDCNKRKNAEGM